MVCVSRYVRDSLSSSMCEHNTSMVNWESRGKHKIQELMPNPSSPTPYRIDLDTKAARNYLDSVYGVCACVHAYCLRP